MLVLGEGQISDRDVLNFGLFILFAFVALLLCFLVDYYWNPRSKSCLSPYSGKPMRRGSELPLSSVEQVMRYLYYEEHSYANRVFFMRKAMICRQTGRIFPNCVSPLFGPKVDWNFLSKQQRGNWVSWGSLSQQQQQELRGEHETLEGFQTEFSSSNPSPRAVEPEYALAKPGPLYVDPDSHLLMGWKCVPETELEVLVVQSPMKLLKLSFEEKSEKRDGHGRK